MLNVEEVTRAEDLGHYRVPWTALCEACPEGNPFQTYEWVTTWLDGFWKGRPLTFLFLKEGAELRGLAPLLPDERGALGCPRSLALPVNDHALRSGILYKGDPGEVLDAALTHLAKARRGMRLTFKRFGADSPLVRAAAELASRHHMGIRTPPVPGSPLIRLDGDWECYDRARPGQVRREMRRKQRKLEKEARVAWSIVSSPGQCAQAMQDVLNIEHHSWKHAAGTSFTAECVAGFYATFATRAAEQGLLRIYLLHLDGRPAAHLYGVAYKGHYYAFKTSYDEAFQHLSPGLMLFEHALRDAFAQGYATLDLLGFESRWKNEVANDLHRHVDVCLFSKHVLSCQWCSLCEQTVKPFVRTRLPLVRVPFTASGSIC